MGTKGRLEQDGRRRERGKGGRAWNSRHRGMRVRGRASGGWATRAYLRPEDNDKSPLMSEKRLMHHNCRSEVTWEGMGVERGQGMSPEVRGVFPGCPVTVSIFVSEVRAAITI